MRACTSCGETHRLDYHPPAAVPTKRFLRGPRAREPGFTLDAVRLLERSTRVQVTHLEAYPWCTVGVVVGVDDRGDVVGTSAYVHRLHPWRLSFITRVLRGAARALGATWRRP